MTAGHGTVNPSRPWSRPDGVVLPTFAPVATAVAAAYLSWARIASSPFNVVAPEQPAAATGAREHAQVAAQPRTHAPKAFSTTPQGQAAIVQATVGACSG